MKTKERVEQLVQIVPKIYQAARGELDIRNPLQVHIETILSAHFTDNMVNRDTPPLFAK